MDGMPAHAIKEGDGKHIILVLDDDSAVTNSLKFVLEVEGFEVRTYADGKELLNAGQLPALGCLIVDYHMPGMNGLEVIAKLRERNDALPAILITARFSPEVRKRAIALGVPVVEKPFMGPQLLECIREVFGGL